MIVHLLGACGGGDGVGQSVLGEPTSTPPPVEGSAVQAGHGHYLGEAAIDGETYFVEALITLDGLVRMHISSFLWDRGAFLAGAGPSGDLSEPEVSMQFVGTVEREGADATGSGTILGQKCHVSVPGRFCDGPALAQIRVAPGADWDLDAELQVSANTGGEVWKLNLSAWSAHYPAGAALAEGRYLEQLAPFRQDGDDMVVDIESGRMSFVSAATGCTGDGTLTPHLDGRYDVHDVILYIESCEGDHALFNDEFHGLATHTQSGYWDYDAWLVVFLAALDGPPPRPALTMRSYQNN